MTTIHLPLDGEGLAKLRSIPAGKSVLLRGTLYTARDQAHKRLAAILEKGGKLPFDFRGAAIYYCGPTPPRADGLFGSAGPTTSARMDPFAPRFYEAGVALTMGKGSRSEAVREACAKHGAVYLTTFGGAGALLATKIKSQRVVAFPELGAEAVYELEVEDFPAMVAFDAQGGSAFGK